MKVNQRTYYVSGCVFNDLIYIISLNLYNSPVRWAFSLLPLRDKDTKNQGDYVVFQASFTFGMVNFLSTHCLPYFLRIKGFGTNFLPWGF